MPAPSRADVDAGSRLLWLLVNDGRWRCSSSWWRLEIKREPVAGELRKLRSAALLVLPRWTAKRQTSPVSRRMQPRLLA
jgi:hypothetical protein